MKATARYTDERRDINNNNYGFSAAVVGIGQTTRATRRTVVGRGQSCFFSPVSLDAAEVNRTSRSGHKRRIVVRARVNELVFFLLLFFYAFFHSFRFT